MTKELVEQRVDIYEYPMDVKKSRGSLTAGDMHGSALKLLRIFLGYNILKLKDEGVAPQKIYNDFADLYERSGDIGRSISKLESSIKFN